MVKAEVVHKAVLTEEILALFKPRNADCLLDATVGHGGHAMAYLEASGPDGLVLGIDADRDALKIAAEKLLPYGERATLVEGNFVELTEIVSEGWKDSLIGGGILRTSQRRSANEREPRLASRSDAKWDGLVPDKPPLFTHVLFDLGVGSHQLADQQRGFSFRSNAMLNMQYGKPKWLPNSTVDALNILSDRLGYYPDAGEMVDGLSVNDLALVISKYGEERYANGIARAIKSAKKKFLRATELADVISRAVPPVKGGGLSSRSRKKIHPATRTFQALRIAANRELEVLSYVLPQAIELIAPGGSIAVISFHSLEDRIVKNIFRDHSRSCICPENQPVCTCRGKPTMKLLTKKPIRASEDEVESNPRSRSAKLRCAQII